MFTHRLYSCFLWRYNGSRFKCEKVRGSYFGASNQPHAEQLALEMSERFSSLATAGYACPRLRCSVNNLTR